MAKRQPPDFRRRQFVFKDRRKIFRRQPAIAGQDRPGQGANDLAQEKANLQREQANQSDRAQRQPVNQAIQSKKF